MVRVELFHDPGLGNGSYLMQVAAGKALLVDPDRRVRRYLRAAEQLELEIVAVAETHLHADFVSGALDVRRATGAELLVPAGAGVGFTHRAVQPGERLALADVELEVRATPGHSPEHVAYVTRDADAGVGVFSGGSMIAGGAARTDLVSPEMTEPLTRAQFRSVREAFDDLPDETVLYPTHGSGSFCSAGAGGPHVSTLAAERSSNVVVTFDGDEDAFVAWWPTTFPAIPSYFARMRAVNAAGPGPTAATDVLPALAPAAFDRARRQGDALVVDCRQAERYAAAHVPGSLSIPFRASFPTWLGWLVPEDTTLLLVTEQEDLTDVVEACTLVGYERVGGRLAGGVEAWVDEDLPVRSTPMIGPEDAVPWLRMGAQPLDVREPDEHALGAIAGAVLVPLGSLEAHAGDLPEARPLLAYCGSGYRSVTAASILERLGIGPVVELRGGYGAWRQAHLD